MALLLAARTPAIAIRALCQTAALAWLIAVGASLSPAQAATNIERVVSPGGIEAWLVREPSLPLVAIDFAFRNGSAQVPANKAGLASLMTDSLDEGAGDIDSRAFHEELENYAIGMGFSAAFSRIGAALGTFALPWAISNIGMGPSMVVAAVVALLGALLSQWLAPETKGRTLAEISADFSH